MFGFLFRTIENPPSVLSIVQNTQKLQRLFSIVPAYDAGKALSPIREFLTACAHQRTSLYHKAEEKSQVKNKSNKRERFSSTRNNAAHPACVIYSGSVPYRPPALHPVKSHMLAFVSRI